MYQRPRVGPQVFFPDAKYTWIIVANNVQARIFGQPKEASELSLIETLSSPAGRLKNQELKEGKPGRGFESFAGSRSRHTKSSEQLPHEQVAEKFAKLIDSKIRRGRLDKRFDDLVLVSNPHFLGLLLANMDAVTKRLVKKKINKDLAHTPDAAIAQYLH